MKKESKLKEIPKFLTFEETMLKLRLKHRSGLMGLIRRNEIGFTMVGKQYRFSESQVIEFLEKNTVEVSN